MDTFNTFRTAFTDRVDQKQVKTAVFFSFRGAKYMCLPIFDRQISPESALNQEFARFDVKFACTIRSLLQSDKTNDQCYRMDFRTWQLERIIFLVIRYY